MPRPPPPGKPRPAAAPGRERAADNARPGTGTGEAAPRPPRCPFKRGARGRRALCRRRHRREGRGGGGGRAGAGAGPARSGAGRGGGGAFRRVAGTPVAMATGHCRRDSARAAQFPRSGPSGGGGCAPFPPGRREGRDAVQCCALAYQYCTRPGLPPPWTPPVGPAGHRVPPPPYSIPCDDHRRTARDGAESGGGGGGWGGAAPSRGTGTPPPPGTGRAG